ncbi:MAG: hypothetical protein JOZ22_25955 [Acidobacteriia bacterium]|nr:hypothetical protein [Terriglobia bacterium]
MRDKLASVYSEPGVEYDPDFHILEDYMGSISRKLAGNYLCGASEAG